MRRMRERTKIIVSIGSMVTMGKLLAVILLPRVLVIILILANAANAIPAGELQDFEVIRHHFTTSNIRRHRKEATQTEVVLDPSESRFIILKLSATVPEDNARIYVHDFRLGYFHRDGKEGRRECKAIAFCETREPGDFGIFHSGIEPYVLANQGKIYFGLAAVIESDVETINIYRVGAKEPLSYYIGSERLYSVLISTNIDDPEMLTAVKEIIKAGGYSVHVSTELSKDTIGTIIHYAEKAETQAREISQRLMIKLRAIPKVKELHLFAVHDIVVWLGTQTERI